MNDEHHYRDNNERHRPGGDQYVCSPADAARGHCHHLDNFNPVIENEFVGGDEESRVVLSYKLEGCTTSCRGHANLAVTECTQWLLDKSHKKLRNTCRGAMRDMLHSCGGNLRSTAHDRRKACQGKASRAFIRRGAAAAASLGAESEREEHPTDCEVCGVVHYFEQHGLSDDVHDASTGASLGSKFIKRRRVELSDTELGKLSKTARAFSENRKDIRGRDDDVTTDDDDDNWRLALKSRGLKAHDTVREVKMQHLEALLGSEKETGVVPADDHPALRPEDTHLHSFMFPTCSAPVQCSHRCYTHVHGAVMRHCGAWINGGDDDGDDSHSISSRRREACAAAVTAAPAACAEEERSRCADVVTVGFEALLSQRREQGARGGGHSSDVKPPPPPPPAVSKIGASEDADDKKKETKTTKLSAASSSSSSSFGSTNMNTVDDAVVTKTAKAAGAAASSSDDDHESNSTTMTTTEKDDTATSTTTILPMQMQSFVICLVALVVVGYVLLRLVTVAVGQHQKHCTETSETETLLGGGSFKEGGKQQQQQQQQQQYGAVDDKY